MRFFKAYHPYVTLQSIPSEKRKDSFRYHVNRLTYSRIIYKSFITYGGKKLLIHDSYEQGLIRDVIAARIPAKLDAAKLFA